MSSLSERVKNMKFMRSSDEQEKSEPTPKPVLSDPSQWSLSSKSYNDIVKKSSTNTSTVGFASISTFDEDSDTEAPPILKRSWGGQTTPVTEPQPEEVKPAFEKRKPLPKAKRVQQDDDDTFMTSDPTEFLNNMFPSKKRDQPEPETEPQTKNKKRKKNKKH